jgi:hypothetical protein
MWRCIYTYPMDDTEDRSIKVATNEEAAAVGAGVHSWRHWGCLGSGRTWMLPSRCLARRIMRRIMAAIAATERRPEPWGLVLSYPATTRTALGVFRSSHCRWTWWRASWLLLQSGCQMRLLWVDLPPGVVGRDAGYTAATSCASSIGSDGDDQHRREASQRGGKRSMCEHGVVCSVRQIFRP